MTAPETIKTDNGKSFLSKTFGELLGELNERGSGTLSFTRGDGGALALLTTDPRMIEILERLRELATPLHEEDDHAGN
ncbi:hypothetical protein SAMN04488503_2502 [Humidesulfovibrio mexicanus]|uniref:Uncharacterized protein n=1 Tax=Humidesulfovibrio mexicanus TaxID=147047 RepID=A0A239BDE2_9BACT|nr:hypothetical protein [Humidesulfovibrio mexicanus]SNS06027.1 hypothetical protein SAMN04488503_2502 [Humidesulfovibrio mexicanus]